MPARSGKRSASFVAQEDAAGVAPSTLFIELRGHALVPLVLADHTNFETDRQFQVRVTWLRVDLVLVVPPAPTAASTDALIDRYKLGVVFNANRRAIEGDPPVCMRIEYNQDIDDVSLDVHMNQCKDERPPKKSHSSTVCLAEFEVRLTARRIERTNLQHHNYGDGSNTATHVVLNSVSIYEALSSGELVWLMELDLED